MPSAVRGDGRDCLRVESMNRRGESRGRLHKDRGQ